MKKYIFTILLIIWMAFIFIMSARDGDTSENISHTVGRFIGSIIVPGFDTLDAESQEAYATNIDFVVRKAAHATEYTILGILSSLCLFSYGFKAYSMWGLLLGIVYAISDEIHQTFVPGRSGQLRDVLIDSGGVIIGCIICYIGIRLMKRKHRGFNEVGNAI